MGDANDLVGRTIADRYDILGLVGVGGMGAVYRARDRELDELVALKVIRPELAELDQIVERFRREVKLARRVTHPNVARIFELGRAGELTFCTMELIDGESLSRRLAIARRLSIGEAIAITCAVCDALTAAHAAGVIHRDIKPDNILIASDGRVVVADFGIATAQIAHDTDLAGTPAYMAPEQARGEAPTPAADVYALGLVLHELLTGRRAFNGTLAEVLAAKQTLVHLDTRDDDRIPPAIMTVIARATESDPAQRPNSAAALRRSLSPWLEAQPIPRPSRPQLAADRQDVPTVIVRPPRGGDQGDTMYLAEAVYEDVIAALGRRAGVRVSPRTNAASTASTASTAMLLELDVDDQLTATISAAGEPTPRARIAMPLTLERIPSAVAVITGAVIAELGLDRVTAVAPATPALDDLLRARHAAQNPAGSDLALFERASALDRADPRIAAGLAMAQIRRVFFVAAPPSELLASAHAMTNHALVTGPHLAESHLAAGHLELHTGDPRIAAGHFRVAIALAPHLPDAHLWLGRLLLEAGFLADGVARLEEAIALAPRLSGARWEIARAWALEGRWGEHDQLVDQIVGPSRLQRERLAGQARFASWRGDRAQLEAVRDRLRAGREGLVFAPALLVALTSLFLGEPWSAHREVILEIARAPSADRRRRAFLLQLAAEAAGFASDAALCVALIGEAADYGLFDLHWLDRCPLLACVRGDDALAPIRAVIESRAHAMLDALYGDHDIRANASSPVSATAKTAVTAVDEDADTALPS